VPSGDLASCHAQCDPLCQLISPGSQCFCTCCNSAIANNNNNSNVVGANTGCFCGQCYTNAEREALGLLREPLFCLNRFDPQSPLGCQPARALRVPRQLLGGVM
jgi:hypothetical protein